MHQCSDRCCVDALRDASSADLNVSAQICMAFFALAAWEMEVVHSQVPPMSSLRS